MAEIFTQIAALLSVFQFLVQVNDQRVQVTEELLRQHEEQRSQEMALILEMLQREERHSQEMALVLEILQHEEQRSQEMALVLEMLQCSQEEPESAQESLWLSACQHWWFWISAEMLLVLFAFYWLPRHGNPGYDGSADGETPAESGRKRRRRRRPRRRRKRMQPMVTGWMTAGLRIRVSF